MAKSRPRHLKAVGSLLLLTLPSAFIGGLAKPPAVRSCLLAVKAEQDVTLESREEQLAAIPLRDAAAQLMVDRQFLEEVNATTRAPELLRLLANHRTELRLAESTVLLQKLLELGGEDLQDPLLVELFQFQVDALQLGLRPSLVISVAELGQRLERKELLTAALEALKPETMRMSDVKAVLTSALAGITELRAEILDVMAERVHRMSPEVMAVVLNTLAEYSEERPELLDDIIARAEEKSFRMTPHEGLGLLSALARLGRFNEALLQHFGGQAAVDISPFSLEELCQWAEVLRRLNYQDVRLLNILAKVTAWRAESMSAAQLDTILLCFKHFKKISNKMSDEARRGIVALENKQATQSTAS